MTAAKLPPGPRGTPLFGNVLQYFRDPLGFLMKCRDYGPVVRIQLPGWPNYMLNDPDLVEAVLRGRAAEFRKDRFTRMLVGVLGQGLLTSEGDFWRRQRRLAQPGFQLNQIQNYADVMVSFTQRALDRWQPGETRNIHADMMRLTLEIVAQALFSADVGSDARDVGEALETVMEYFANPFNWYRIRQWIPTPGLFRYRRAIRKLDRVIYDLIERRRREGTGPDDLLSRMLAARDEDGGRMTDRQLRDEVMTLFLAGHETTALALTYGWYLLAQHPEAVARLTEELDRVLDGRPPTAADFPRLHYAEWVVRESMRLYPPVPAIGREAIADCELGGYPIAKGTQLWLVQWVAHRDPRWFDDPESFKPERWDGDLAKTLPRGAYFPFGDGPRICIGNNFAMMEAVLILAAIALRFRLELTGGTALEFVPSITLRPKHGVSMRVCAARGPADAAGGVRSVASAPGPKAL